MSAVGRTWVLALLLQRISCETLQSQKETQENEKTCQTEMINHPLGI